MVGLRATRRRVFSQRAPCDRAPEETWQEKARTRPPDVQSSSDACQRWAIDERSFTPTRLSAVPTVPASTSNLAFFGFSPNLVRVTFPQLRLRSGTRMASFARSPRRESSRRSLPHELCGTSGLPRSKIGDNRTILTNSVIRGEVVRMASVGCRQSRSGSARGRCS